MILFMGILVLLVLYYLEVLGWAGFFIIGLIWSFIMSLLDA